MFLFSSFLSFEPEQSFWDRLTHMRARAHLTPYRPKLMQEEMKYHHLRGKHTSVHTHETCSLTDTHAYIYMYTSYFAPEKNALNSALQYRPNIKAHICLFSTSHTIFCVDAFLIMYPTLINLHKAFKIIDLIYFSILLYCQQYISKYLKIAQTQLQN